MTLAIFTDLDFSMKTKSSHRPYQRPAEPQAEIRLILSSYTGKPIFCRNTKCFRTQKADSDYLRHIP